MAYPRVGQAFQLPIGSNKSTIDQVSSITIDGLTIICIRSSSNQLELRSFYQCNGSVIVGSLRLSLPRETSNRVVSSVLLSIYPKLFVTILTLTGTLITLDLSRFLIKGCLPEITQSEVKESKSHVDCLLTPTRRLSLFDLSVGSQDRSDSSGAANLGTDSNGKFGRYLQTSLTLEQTLKLAINIEELGHHLNEAEATNFPLCIESFSRNRYDTSEKHATVGPRCGGNVPIQQLIIKSSVGCQNGFLLIFERQECTHKEVVQSTSPTSSSALTSLAPIGNSMIISGYDIGPLASAALHMAGAYTPSYSNSFKVHMMTNKQLGMNGVNNAKLTAASTDSYCAPKNAHSLRAESFPSSIKDKGRIGMRTGSSDRNMKEINSLRKIKCFDFDILQIIKSHSSSSSRTRTSSGSSSSSSSSRRECQRIKGEVLVSDRTGVLEASVPIGCITHLQANSLPSSGDIITSMGAATAAIKAEVAHVEDDDYSGDEALYLDTPQGVFVYLHDHQGDRETGAEADENSKIEGSRKKAGKAEVNGSVDDEDEDKDDDEDEYEGDIEDNWRDQGSVEEEEEEGDEEEENGKVSEFGRRENDLGNNNGLDRTSKKRKSLRDGDVHTFTPTQGSMLKLLTSSIDGICIGQQDTKNRNSGKMRSSKVDETDFITESRSRDSPVRCIPLTLNACGDLLGRSGRRSPGVRTLIPDEEAAVLAACSRCNRCSLPPSTAASSSSDSQLVTPNNSKVPEDFSVVGVLDSPLGILLLYLFSHSLDRCSGPVTDTYDANVKRERSRSNEEKNVRKSRQKRRMNKSEFKEIHPFCYVDIKWLLQFEERHLETPMSDIKSVGRGGEGGRVVGGGGQGCDISIANRESPKGKGKRRMKTEEVVERVAFLENTMVVVTKTNLRVTVLAPQTETVDLEVEHNWHSQRGSQGSIRESKIDRLTLMSDGGNGSGHAGAGTMDVSRSQSGSGYIGEGSKENVKFSNSNAATDTSKRWEVEERVENDDDENDEFKIIGGTIFTFHLKDTLKVTRCLRLPSSDCVVRSVCAAGYCNGRERESTLHDRLFVVTSTHVYFVDDIVLHKVTSNCSSAADTASDHVDDHVDDDFTHDSIASFKMTFASHVSMDFGSPSSANVTTMDPLSVPVPSSVSITNIDPLLVPVPSSVSITNSDPLSVPVPSSVSITNKDPLLVPVPSGVSITNSDPLSVPTLPSGIVYRTRQDLIALGQRELDLFNSRKPTGKAHQKDGIIAKNIPWPADPSIRMEIFLNSSDAFRNNSLKVLDLLKQFGIPELLHVLNRISSLSKINSCTEKLSKPQNVEEEEEEKKYDEFQVEKDYPEMKKSIFYAEEKEKEEKKVKNDELLFLKVSASALLLVLKRISDQAFLNSQKSSGAVKFDNTSSILLLKLKLQLLLFPLATPSAKSSIDCESAYNTTFGSMFHSPIMKSSATIIEHCKKEESRIDVGDKDKVILTLEALPERGMMRRDEFSEIYKYGTIQGQSAYAKQSGCYDTATSSSSIPKALSANVSISSGNATVTRMTHSNVECSTTGGRGDSQAVTYPSSSSSSPPRPPPPLLLSPSTTQTPSFTSIHKALEVFEKIPSNKAVVTAAAAAAAAASTGTSTKISSVFSTGQVGLCNPDEETVTHEPTTLRDYSTELRELLTILIASQDALSEILNLLTTQHHTIIKSIPPTTSPYTAKYSHRDKKKNGDVSIGINFSSAKMGRKSPEKKGEGVKEDNVSDEERIWIDLMTLCGHLQCTACTCALLFFSSTFSQRSTELCFVEKHISSSSPEVMLMLFEIPFSRLLAFESYVKSNIKYQSNGSAHSEKKGNVEIGEIEDEVDDFQEMCDHYQYHQYASDELWAILIHILGNFAPLALPDPKPKVSAPFNLEYAGWGLGQVLLQWIRCGIPIVMFERKVSDLSTESDRFISDQTKSKNLVIILRLLLFTWRVRVPERTIPESIYIKKESIGQSQEDSSVGCLSECLPTHLSFNTRLISQSIWLKEVHAIRFSTHFLLKIASLK